MDKVKDVVSKIGVLDEVAMRKARVRIDNLTKPLGSLGRLEEIASHLVGVGGETIPKYTNKVVFTLAADHGVADEGVSAFPKEVTTQMVLNFLRGGAAINVFARLQNAKVVVVDIGVASDLPSSNELVSKKISYGTRNMAKGPAMTRDEAIKSIEVGIELFQSEFDRGLNIVCTGDMGIGNTTSSSAITAAVTGAPVEDVTGRGTGLDDKGLKNKIETIKRTLKVNKPNQDDAIDILSKIGGFEIGGLAGIIIASAAARVPVVLDGFNSGAAALIAAKLSPKAINFMLAGHISQERGHAVALKWLGLKPILILDMRLGEGTGAVLALNIIEAASRMYSEMATFEDAGISGKL